MKSEPMRVIDHKKMRRVIGAIAFFLPIAVVILSGRDDGLSSISISYWTESRDIFVGALFAVGFYLAAYNGPGRCGRSEKWISRVAGLCAVCIAIFPTDGFADSDAPASWLTYLTGWTPFEPVHLHKFTAFVLFFCLFLMLLIFSFRASRKGKELRSKIYLALAIGMSAGLLVLYLILGVWLGRSDTVYYLEFAGLLLFGVGWYVAGKYLSERVKIPADAELLTIEPIEVDPGIIDVPTGIKLGDFKGEKLIFVADGCWMDWFIHCGPEGWGPKWNLFTRKNRLRGQPIFALCGSIGKGVGEASSFYIGGALSWSVPEDIDDQSDCELHLYANDRSWAYWNNKEQEPNQGGPVKVTVYRLRTA